MKWKHYLYEEHDERPHFRPIERFGFFANKKKMTVSHPTQLSHTPPLWMVELVELVELVVLCSRLVVRAQNLSVSSSRRQPSDGVRIGVLFSSHLPASFLFRSSLFRSSCFAFPLRLVVFLCKSSGNGMRRGFQGNTTNRWGWFESVGFMFLVVEGICATGDEGTHRSHGKNPFWCRGKS